MQDIPKRTGSFRRFFSIMTTIEDDCSCDSRESKCNANDHICSCALGLPSFIIESTNIINTCLADSHYCTCNPLMYNYCKADLNEHGCIEDNKCIAIHHNNECPHSNNFNEDIKK